MAGSRGLDGVLGFELRLAWLDMCMTNALPAVLSPVSILVFFRMAESQKRKTKS